MNISFANDPEFQAAMHAGILEAVTSPEFIRALAAALGPEMIWLTAEQVRGLTQLRPRTFAVWVQRYRKKGLIISSACQRKHPLYRLDSVQAVLNAEAVGQLPGMLEFPKNGAEARSKQPSSLNAGGRR